MKTELNVDEATVLYRALLEDSLHVPLLELEQRFKPIHSMTVKDLLELAKAIPLVVMRGKKAAILKALFSPIYQRAFDLTRQKGL